MLKGMGCYSYNFIKEDEKDITFSRLLKNFGIDISTITYEETRDAVTDIVGFDIKKYLDRCLCLDAITFNEDRYLNNLSVIKMKNGYREAPIYDNGLSCMADTFTYKMDTPLEENLRNVYAATFDTNFIRQLESKFVTPICINVKAFFASVEAETAEERRALEVIRAGLERTRGLAWQEI